MSLRISLAKSNHMTMICAHVSTLISTDEAKDEFYESFSSVLQSANSYDKLMLLGDFNAIMGNVHLVLSDVLGRHCTLLQA